MKERDASRPAAPNEPNEEFRASDPRAMRAKSRWTDPDTSSKAAARVEREGTAGTHRRLCLDEVRKNPGRTAAEIAEALGLERHIPSRRLPDLRQAGLVTNGPSRVCGVVGNLSMTWVPSEPKTTPLTQGKLF